MCQSFPVTVPACPHGVCWRFPGSLLCSGRLLVVCSIGLVWFHTHHCPLRVLSSPDWTHMLPSLENSCHGHCTCQIGASGRGMSSWAWAPPFLWGPEISWERGNGVDLAGSMLALTSLLLARWCWLCLPRGAHGPVLQQPQSPESCSCSSQRAGTPRYIQIITSALEPWPTARSPSQQWGSWVCWCQSPQPYPGCGTQRGQAAPLLTNKLSEVLLGSFTTGKPNTLDILIVCCEIVS